MKGILGKKLGMTQLFKDDKLIPVTLVQAGPCVVSDIKTENRDGYTAVQIGYGEVKEDKVNKPTKGHFAKNKIEPKKVLVELRLPDTNDYSVGQTFDAGIFAEGEKADVTGISKGKGFAGVMKRWNFKGQGASHGAHRVHRKPGSIGSSATPSRVFPGKKMAGRMGNARVTTKGLEIVKVDAEKNLIAVRGAIPGANGSVVLIKGAS